jgi:hypothetical protein
VDLIAGNGGDTVNYGIVGDLKFFVGAGGSVSNVTVAGEIGNTDTVTPLKSYIDVLGGQTMAQFVTANFVDNPDAFFSVLDDSLGSVGIQVGAAGRLKTAFLGYNSNNQPIYESQPATGGHNGSLISVSAHGGISAAVAGTLDRIAAIATVRDVSVASGTVGEDKPGPFPYLDENGNGISAPVVGGALVDGALIAGSIPTIFDPKLGREVPDPTLLGNSHVFVL